MKLIYLKKWPMRLTNYRATKFLPGIYFFTIVLGIVTFFLYQLMGKQFLPSIKYLYALESLVVIALIYTYINGKYFEFDSEGALIGIYTRGVIFSEVINYRDKRFDLKREHIYKYSILNLFFYKRLTLYYKSSTRKQKIKINITLLSPRKTRYLRKSLSKLVRQNSKSL